MELIAFIPLFLVSSALSHETPIHKVLFLNNGSVGFDSIQRLRNNVDQLGLSMEEFMYANRSMPYDKWFNQTVSNWSSEAHNFYAIIVNSIPVLVTSNLLKTREEETFHENLTVFQCPKRSCDEIDQATKDILPTVIMGRSKIVQRYFAVPDKDPVYTDKDERLYSVDFSLTDKDVVKSMNDIHFNHNASVIVSCSAENRNNLDQVSNYLKESMQCYFCRRPATSQSGHIAVALFVEESTPFLEQFFERILKLNYSKSQISLLIHNNVEAHKSAVQKFMNSSLMQYRKVLFIGSEADITVNEAKMDAIRYCFDHRDSITHILMVSSTALIDDIDVIQHLTSLDRSVVAPLLVRQSTLSLWTNFWGDVNNDGFYVRSFDYTDIVSRTIRGVWNVPYISSCILLSTRTVVILHEKRLVGDPDMALPKLLRTEGIFMYISNLHDHYGWLVNPDTYNASIERPDLFQIEENPEQWRRKYIQDQFWTSLASENPPAEPVRDVFWFPLVTNEFCDDVIAVVTSSDAWSGGKHDDSRLPGGYENVPTDDIHMKQIGFSEGWHKILKDYIMPMQQKIFLGYIKEPPSAPLSFVVRYHPDRQDRLKPHHDSSTYTINMALNSPDVDYTGGGVRFHRYRKDITDLKKGWVLMHPGRLTHLHEGLPTTNGTRYIFVSFVDP